MKRKNKASAPTEEMEFTFLPEGAPNETVIPEKSTTSVSETAELPPEEADTESIDGTALPKAEEELPADVQPQPRKPKEPGILGICLPLIIICIGVALMLAAVNALTADTIAAQAAAEKERAVMTIFPDATSAQLYEITEDGEIYLAIRENNLIGCCISLASGGFAGDISMMVGRTAAGEICGVQIVSMSESPGIGTKTKSAAFLSQYRGAESFVIGQNVDAISGATVSSRAVTAGVNRALDLPLDFPAIAGAYGLTVSAETGPNPETVPAETDAPATSPTEVPGEGGEKNESTSSLLTMPAISPSASVNRVVLVSTTHVTEVETEAVETEPEMPETEIPEETDEPSAEDVDVSDDTTDTAEVETSDDTTDTAEVETSDDTTDTTETETSAETTGPSETDIPEETTVSPEVDESMPADTTTESDPVDSAVTEPDSDAAAA